MRCTEWTSYRGMCDNTSVQTWMGKARDNPQIQHISASNTVQRYPENAKNTHQLLILFYTTITND